MLTERDIRNKVKILKQFYMDLISYAFVNFLLIVIWLMFDKSRTFWPKYVLVVWGIALVFKAYRTGIASLFVHHVAFLTPAWEERKVKEMMEHPSLQRKIFLKRDLTK